MVIQTSTYKEVLGGRIQIMVMEDQEVSGVKWQRKTSLMPVKGVLVEQP